MLKKTMSSICNSVNVLQDVCVGPGARAARQEQLPLRAVRARVRAHGTR